MISTSIEKPIVHIILPKTLIDDKKILKKGTLFFLAGPIKGGGDWQFDMVKTLRNQARLAGLSEITIAIPCNYSKDHPLQILATHTILELDGRLNAFDRTVTWERHYLERAAALGNGCIIFWLPCESQTHPRKDGHPYGMDTRGELGEWRGRMKENAAAKYSVIIGADANFHGLSTLKRNFDDALSTDFPIYDSIKETARRAIELTDKIQKI